MKPRYFYIYEILSNKILAVFTRELGQEASETYSKLLKDHGPHYLLATRAGTRLGVGETLKP